MSEKKIRVRESLRASFKDGIFASIMLGITEHYVIPFALHLGATAQQIGWVSGLPHLLASISQLFATSAVDRFGGRLALLIRAVGGQAFLLLLIAFLPLIDFPFRVEVFLLLLVLFAISGALTGPAWGSLMTDYIPSSRRGYYFAWRNRILGGIQVGSMIVAGLLLYGTRDYSSILGFFIIFLMGAAARFISAGYIAQVSDVPQRKNPGDDFTFLMFVARFGKSNFVKFVAFVASLTFGKRVRCISYFNVINGTALFLGATAGGFLASRLPAMQGYSLLSLFALSGLCRLFFYLILFRRFQEVRPSKEVSIQELFFSVVGVRPLIGVSRD